MKTLVRRPIEMVALCLLTALAACNGNSSGGNSLSDQYRSAMQLSSLESRGGELVRIAYQQQKAGDELGADTSLSSAADAASKIEDAAVRAKIYNLVAYARGYMGRETAAKKLLREVRKAIKEIGDPSSKALATNKMALIYGLFLDDQGSAKDYLAQAEQDAAEIKLADMRIGTLARIADSYHQVALSEDAARLIQTAQEQAEATEDLRQRTDSLAEVAMRLHHMERTDDADATFEKAAVSADQIEDSLQKAYALVNLADKAQSAGLGAKAVELLDKASTTADEIGDLSMRNPLLEKIERQRRGS